MIHNTNKQLAKYYKDIKNELVCSEKEKRSIIDMIKENIEDYISEHPDVSFDELIKHFGTPQEIAGAYCATEGTDAIRAKLKTKKIIVLSVIGALLIALLAYIIAMTVISCDAMNDNSIHYYEAIIGKHY